MQVAHEGVTPPSIPPRADEMDLDAGQPTCEDPGGDARLVDAPHGARLKREAQHAVIVKLWAKVPRVDEIRDQDSPARQRWLGCLKSSVAVSVDSTPLTPPKARRVRLTHSHRPDALRRW